MFWQLCWLTEPLAATQNVAWWILEPLWTLQVREEKLTLKRIGKLLLCCPVISKLSQLPLR